VAKKMSWAAKRRTTRVEDIAYCLLGIFGINMSLLYGEGKRAFQRLQHKIMKAYPEDQTLFAWGVLAQSPSMEVTDPGVLSGMQTFAWDAKKVREPLLGLLAQSPKDFEHSSSLVALSCASNFYRIRENVRTPRAFGKAVQLSLIYVGTFSSLYHRGETGVSQILPSVLVCILCTDREKISSLLLPLYPWGNCHGRTRTLIPGPKVVNDGMSNIARTYYVQGERRLRLRGGDFVIRGNFCSSSWLCYGLMFNLSEKLEYMTEERVIRPETYNKALFSIQYAQGNKAAATRASKRFMLLFGRSKAECGPQGVFTLGFTPLSGDGEAHAKSADAAPWPAVHEAAEDAQFSVSATDYSWTLDNEGFPRIQVNMTRVPLEEGRRGVVDMFDIHVLVRENMSHPRVRKL
jgi:hypothetical protein